MDIHPFATPQYNPYLFSAICIGWTVTLAMFGAWKVFWLDYTGPDEN
jgi:hypothetical protein